jgi:hypothetical protein
LSLSKTKLIIIRTPLASPLSGDSIKIHTFCNGSHGAGIIDQSKNEASISALHEGKMNQDMMVESLFRLIVGTYRAETL